MRIAQRDILRFTTDPGHVSPPWPAGYWPPSTVPASERALHRSVESFLDDLHTLRTMVADPATDLFSAIPHGEGQTVLREILLVADHNAYHMGQLMLILTLSTQDRS